MSAPQYCNRENIPHNNQKFGQPPLYLFFPRGAYGRRTILMDFYSYGYETFLFNLTSAHEEA